MKNDWWRCLQGCGSKLMVSATSIIWESSWCRRGLNAYGSLTIISTRAATVISRCLCVLVS